jgi:hypothetical protein
LCLSLDFLIGGVFWEDILFRARRAAALPEAMVLSLYFFFGWVFIVSIVLIVQIWARAAPIRVISYGDSVFG